MNAESPPPVAAARSSSPWVDPPTLEQLNALNHGTMNERCGIVFTELGPDYVRGTMPVTQALTQPYGLLHGGASVVLAETLGSTGAACAVDRNRFRVVGQEINANHLQASYPGDTLTATARPFHIGARSQVWGIEIRDQRDRLICISRITMAVIARRGG